MRQAQDEIVLNTRGQELYEITGQVRKFVAECGLRTGLVTLFCQHTSCSLTIQENADPDVRLDLLRFVRRLAPEDAERYTHASEGPDDMPAHIKSMLTDVSVSIPIVRAQLGLGTWQGIYLFEHRVAPHERHVIVHAVGE